MTTKEANLQSSVQPAQAERNTSAASIVGFAVIGCLVAGLVSIFKAMTMTTGAGVLCCVFAALVSFGSVIYICLRK